MKIQIDPHTLNRAVERGTTKDEIRDVINTGFSIPAKGFRRGKAKVFDYGKKRLEKWYSHKRVEVIYAEQHDKIITVTVYVFYGNWKEQT
jgi:hypothetical protein